MVKNHWYTGYGYKSFQEYMPGLESEIKIFVSPISGEIAYPYDHYKLTENGNLFRQDSSHPIQDVIGDKFWCFMLPGILTVSENAK